MQYSLIVSRGWIEANQHCLNSQQQDAQLISIGSADEMDIVEEIIGKYNQSSHCNHYWIGGKLDRRLGEVHWTDGRMTSYNNFDAKTTTNDSSVSTE